MMKKWISLLLVALMLLAIAPVAMADPEVTITEDSIVTIVNCKNSANVREKATSNSAKIGEAKRGKTFQLLAVEGNWYKIQYTKEKTGYVFHTYVKVGKKGDAPLADTATVTNAVYGANNTLAIEYLKAIKGTSITPFTVKRTTPHDSDELNTNFASASHIREVIRRGREAHSFTPMALIKTDVTDMKNIEPAILYRLAMMTKDDFANVPYTDGFESRLFEASRTASTLTELYDRVKTKNVTHARVRRAVMLASLGITEKDMQSVPYARILAMNTRGAEVLSVSKATTKIAVSASLAALSQISKEAERIVQLDELSSRLLHLALNQKGGHVSEFSKKFEITR